MNVYEQYHFPQIMDPNVVPCNRFYFEKQSDNKNYIITPLKLVCYFLSNFYFSPNDSPSKSMKNVFIWFKKLFSFSRYLVFFFCLPIVFSLSTIDCFSGWSKVNLKVYDIIKCLNKNLTHFVWYIGEEKR